MHFGATMWFTEYSISPSELGIALEERGFESLWASEHSHLPAPENAGVLRNEQADVMDPFLTLTAAAVSTKTLRLGTGICLVNQRDPIQTAKLVTTIVHPAVLPQVMVTGLSIAVNPEPSLALGAPTSTYV